MDDPLETVQTEVDGIKALGNVIGAVFSDQAGVDDEHIASLGYLIFDLAGKLEIKLADWVPEEKAQSGLLPESPPAAKTEASREDFHQAVRLLSKFKDDPAGKLMDKIIDISLQDEAGRVPAQAFAELEARMAAIIEEAKASTAA